MEKGGGREQKVNVAVKRVSVKREKSAHSKRSERVGLGGGERKRG